MKNIFLSLKTKRKKKNFTRKYFLMCFSFARGKIAEVVGRIFWNHHYDAAYGIIHFSQKAKALELCLQKFKGGLLKFKGGENQEIKKNIYSPSQTCKLDIKFNVILRKSRQ